MTALIPGSAIDHAHAGLITDVGVLLLLACAVVALLARRLRLPYTVALLLSGLALRLIPSLPDVPLTRELVFTGLLPPLILEAALNLRWTGLQILFSPIIGMASGGLMLAAMVTAVGMHLLAGWPVLQAAIFGALIAATDPVSVIATLKEQRAPRRLQLLLEAESLFNDGTAAVLFSVVLAISAGIAPTPGNVMAQATLMMGGGVLCGAVVAKLLVFLIGRTDDPLVEITFSVVAAYGAFLLADHWAASGVLATLTAGLIFGAHQRAGTVCAQGRDATHAFWEFAAFVANALVFLLIGLQLAQQDYLPLLPDIGLAIVIVLAGRCCAVYPVAWLFSRSQAALDPAEQHLLVWGGLRGALGLALAVGLPADLAHRKDIITVTYAVVAFSVLVQGLTMPWLLAHQAARCPPDPTLDSVEKCHPD